MALRKLAIAVASGGLLAVLAAPMAGSAHVSVSGQDAVRGGDAVLTFHVPTESDTASTTKVQVHLPSAPPLSSVLVRSTPGWTAKVIGAAQAVTEIDWTADSPATAIKPGEFQEFVISVETLPNVASLSFPTLQTYSDGSVVKWIESPAPGSTAEPEHPVPVLTLAAASPGDNGPKASSSSKSSDTGAVVLGIVALVVAAGALGLGIVNRARAGRT